MRFRIGASPVPPRRFRLPEGEHATAPALPELGKPFKPRVWGAGAARETYKRTTKAQTHTQADVRTSRRGPDGRGRAVHGVRSGVGPRKGRKILEFVAASEYEMAGFMGTLALRIDRDSVDLTRLGLGLLSLAIDHDAGRLMGRITGATVYDGRLDMEAEVSTTPTATEAMREIDDLTRAGFSPGFLIHETETLSEGDRGYDPDQMFQIVVTRWEPYEISSTAIPRSPDARLKGVASMNKSNVAMDDGIMDVPELVSREDVIGLSLAAARKVLASGKGSAAQRSKLTEFFTLFDAGLERGLSRDVAAQAAKAVAGI